MVVPNQARNVKRSLPRKKRLSSPKVLSVTVLVLIAGVLRTLQKRVGLPEKIESTTKNWIAKGSSQNATAFSPVIEEKASSASDLRFSRSPPYAEITHVPSQRHRRNKHLTSLTVGFWAPRVTDATTSTLEKSTLHRYEVEAAILNNLHNPSIDQVVIVLDSSHDLYNCSHTLDHFKSLSDSIQVTYSNLFADGKLAQKPGELTCVDRLQGQPTYLEMFQYAAHPKWVHGDIAGMANADQAFDATLSKIQSLRRGAVAVLSTSGYEKSQMSKAVFAHYHHVVNNNDWQRQPIPSSAFSYQNLCTNWPGTSVSFSWDSYWFHRDEVMDAVLDLPLESTLFQRQTSNSTPFFSFHMNERGAENAALRDLHEAMGGKVSVWNPCLLIRSWHFHLAPKMHKPAVDVELGRWVDRVPRSSTKTPFICDKELAALVLPDLRDDEVADCPYGDSTI